MVVVNTRFIKENLNLEIISGENSLDREINSPDISRPALQLAGYFSHYDPTRVQVLGRGELSFFKLLTHEDKKARTRMLCTRKTPAIIITRGLEVPKELIDSAKKYDTPLLRTDETTSRLIAKLAFTLHRELAKEISMHGVLVEVYGVGILITGESGIGKSEIALELIKRGHRLISDDRVDIKELDSGFLIGRCGSSIIKNLLEIRGLGIINVMTLFGVGAVGEDKAIDLNIHLESWDKNKNYDRIGLERDSIKIHNTEIEKKVIPVSPGRNMAIIIESAAMNFKLNKMGINTSEQFEKNLTEKIMNNREKI